MKVTDQIIPGVKVLEPRVFGDSRGFFFETWNKRTAAGAGIHEDFVQDNCSLSRKGVLRGLHLQNPDPQGKLVYVLSGSVFDVAVDVRRGSPTFGKWVGTELSEENRKQLYLPPGVAHGFVVLSETALFLYKCTQFYRPDAEISIRWDDPDLGIQWPLRDVTVSGKDQAGLRLRDVPEGRLTSLLSTPRE